MPRQRQRGTFPQNRSIAQGREWVTCRSSARDTHVAGEEHRDTEHADGVSTEALLERLRCAYTVVDHDALRESTRVEVRRGAQVNGDVVADEKAHAQRQGGSELEPCDVVGVRRQEGSTDSGTDTEIVVVGMVAGAKFAFNPTENELVR